ncbi:LysR family transcriptional regulator [Clostridium sp. AM58-1XD]|uniref:LysR family transcriptional regulator n=1 Tax=Clostridium sp. AM58-1XD TaxID=2292307 RepID=UPI000E4DF5C3|nr:LysR family transcriptional regulator [Clostridium sp. AM58-1XD]RGY97233.1 LysR family transcriptional regulator [Clostridium sp. AM58-1XD]
MDLLKCRYIITIADQQSFSKAAATMFVSQPYLSKLVADIENELGSRLFIREKNKVYLTKAGECYIKYAKELLLTEQNMLADLREFSEGNKGRITIGFPPTNGSYILPYAFRDFRSMYPDVEIIIEENDNQSLMEHTLNATIDLCFFSLLEYPADLDFELIKMEPILLVLPPGHPLGTPEAKGNFKNPPFFHKKDIEKLAADPCLTLKKNKGIGMIAYDIFEQCQITPNVIFETNNIETAYRMAATGSGFTFIPEICTRFSTFDEEPYYYKISLDLKEVYHRSHVAAFRKGRNLQTMEKALIDVIRKYA